MDDLDRIERRLAKAKRVVNQLLAQRAAIRGTCTASDFPVEYAAWNQMIQRCYNENVESYDRYGGRGISVCDEWRASFAAFMVDMGPKPTPELSLDRVDSNDDYRPGNCQWGTKADQARNRRRRGTYTHVPHPLGGTTRVYHPR